MKKLHERKIFPENPENKKFGRKRRRKEALLMRKKPH